MSRRKAGEVIKDQRIKINNILITEPWFEVNPDEDEILLDGKRICKTLFKKVVYAINKPSNYITTMADYRGRKTVKDLITGKIKENVFHVGRLDMNTHGLLLLTNDGELANKLTHPSSGITKTYIATISGILSRQDIDSLEKGITLKDGFKTAGATLKILRTKGSQSIVKLIITEGHKREVREMFNSIGKEVIDLERVSIGNLSVKIVPVEGAIKRLNSKEIAKLNEKGTL